MGRSVHGWIYITSSHGGSSPIYVVRLEGRGVLSPAPEGASDAADPLAWSAEKGGSYMSTPVVYEDYLYLGNSNGVLRRFNAFTGEKVYEKRLGRGARVISSLVAGDEKIFCASENGSVYVLSVGPEFKILSTNPMGDPCLATPAISEGVLFFRTISGLIAIK